MMISPEAYYRTKLKGRDEKHILSIIRELKKRMKNLKIELEHPDYIPMRKPTEDVQLSCTRQYLECAIQALGEIGVEYQPTKKEIKAKEFQDDLEFLSKITFEIGGFFSGISKYVIEFHENKANFIMEESDYLLEEKSLDKERVIYLLSQLYIGEWEAHYDTEKYGCFVLDGTQWNLSFEYVNGHKKVEFSGNNSYPYNFKEFLEIFGKHIYLLGEMN